MRLIKRYRKLKYTLGVVIVTYLVICFVLARGYISPSRRESPAPPQGVSDLLVNGPGYQLPIWATKGLVKGRPNSDTVYVMVHGYTGSRQFWRKLVEYMVKHNQEVVVPAMRAHDTNPASMSAFGKLEGDEVLDTVRWVRSRYRGQSPHIILCGTSLGAAACWYASQKEPSMVDAVVSDSAFADFPAACDRWLDRTFPGASMVLKPAVWMAELMCGVKRGDVDPIQAAKLWIGRPALVIHGTKDALLDKSHGERIAAAAQCPIWVVEDMTHSGMPNTDPASFARKLYEVAERARKRR